MAQVKLILRDLTRPDQTYNWPGAWKIINIKKSFVHANMLATDHMTAKT